MAVNDAIEAGLSADDIHEGMMNMLARIGKILEAEKACIFEVQEDGSFKTPTNGAEKAQRRNRRNTSTYRQTWCGPSTTASAPTR